MIMYGKPVVDKLKIEHISKIAMMDKKPSLAIFADMSHRPSVDYVKKKLGYCCEVGVNVKITDLSQIKLKESVDLISSCEEDGIIIQMPSPHDPNQLIQSINLNKDVDGLHPFNLGTMWHDQDAIISCTAQAVDNIIQYYIGDITGLHVVIINDSLVLGKPLAAVLNHRKATITICNQYTKNLVAICQTSDIIVSAVGKENFFIPDECLHSYPYVIDVAAKRDNNVLIGDLRDSSKSKTRGYSPVPGGVGPVTVACVVSNLLKMHLTKK